MRTKPFLFTYLLIFNLGLFAQRDVNYDEAAIPSYNLPELLSLSNGQEVVSFEDWESKRRDEILTLFRDEVYGNQPKVNLEVVAVDLIEERTSALNNTATRTQKVLIYERHGKQLKINILIYLPKDLVDPPVFVGYNFYGNQSIISDPNIILTDAWVRNNNDLGITDERASEASRGKRSHRWPIQKIIDKGFGIALTYYGDVDPDKNDFTDGVHFLGYEQGQAEPRENQWGAIGAWAWGLSEVLSEVKKDLALRGSKFIAFGHSRLGKTSLWAGALDTRFDIVISNNSGCGGAALFRRKYGETAGIINNSFPYWFNTNFKKYGGNEEALPIDQHMLIALMAPRPVYIASAEEDRWADPKGEYLSGYHATPVYNLYNEKGMESDQQPDILKPIHNAIGYHKRAGKHGVTDYDWEQYMKFAMMHFSK